MDFKRLCILKLVMLTVLENSSSHLSPCGKPEVPLKSFKILIERGPSGDWTTRVLWYKPGEQIPAIWGVNFEQTVTQCADKQYLQFTATVVGPAPNTTSGYEYFPGIGFYKLHTTGKTWADARKTCEEEGGYLAVINSEAEAKTLKDMVEKRTPLEDSEEKYYVLVGFHDFFKEGEYLTILGNSLESSGYTGWADLGNLQQPDNAFGNENCGSLFIRAPATHMLNDIRCSLKVAFLCERH